MSRIIVVGGHGKVALLLSAQLTEAGHEVSSVIRNPDHAADVRATGAVPVVSDVEHQDRASLADLVAGHDAVVWSAGAGGGSADRTFAVDRDAAIRSMDAAADAGVRRYVMVSYSGSRLDHGIPEDDGFFAYAQAKAEADEHLRGTDLDWTVLGPSTLTDDAPTGRIEVAEESTSVPRSDVAAVVVAALAEPATIGTTVRFNSGDVPIAELLAAASSRD